MRRITFAFTFIFLALLVVDAYPGLRGGAGWRWPYQQPEHWPAVVILALVVIVYLLGLVMLRQSAAAPMPTLTWIILSGAALGFAAAGIQSGNSAFTLFTRTVSPVQTGASIIAVRELAANGVRQSLGDWPRIMREAHDANIIHFTTSPPGQPLIHHTAALLIRDLPGAKDLSMALRQFQCTDPVVMAYTRGELISVALVGMLMPLWATLAAVPIYFAAMHLIGDTQAALRMASWWPLVPSVLMFTPTWNTLYPALAAGSFALLLTGIKQDGWRQSALIVGAGLLMSAATFLNFAVMPVLLIFGLFVLLTHWLPERRTRHTLMIGLWFGLGLLSLWIIYWSLTGLTPLDLASVTADQHSELVAGRDFLAWLILHPYDVLMFTGWPLVALFVAGMIYAIKRDATRNSQVMTLGLSLLITIILVDLTGAVQGENARIMSYYAPFILLGSTALLQRSARWDMPLLVAQGLSVLVMAAVLPVVPLDLNPPPAGPRSDLARLDVVEPIPLDATFQSETYAGTFSLTSYRFIADLGQQVITLETIWQGREQVERPYQFVVVAQAENDIDGQIITEPQSWYAQNGYYLPTCWRKGETVHNLVMIHLPPVSMPVTWTLELRAVDPRTGDVMTVLGTDGGQSDHVTLGPVNYP
jgi:methylthioxylose transferase